MLKAAVVHFGRNSVAEGPRIVTQVFVAAVRNVLLSSFFVSNSF